MRITLTGTQSVGKTSLTIALSKLPEFKDYKFFTEKSKDLMDLGIPLNTDSTLKGQTIFLAHRCAELIEPNFISDRSIIDVISYANSAKSMTPYEKESFSIFARNFIQEYDYIFYVSPQGVEIEDNGVRETSRKYRDQIDIIIRNQLEYNKNRIKNLYTIFGSTKNRIQQIKEAMNL